MAKRTYIWYIEPLNDRANEAIYECSKNIELDATIEPATCEDGKKHNLWECSIQSIKLLCSSRQDFNLKFEVWGKEGFKGKIRKKTFLFIKSRKKKKTAR